MRHERDDGLDTVEWLRRQPWFNGRLGTFGPSYVGYTQWAIADVPELAAMATVVTASSFRDPTYAGDSFSLFTTLAWASILHAQEGAWLASTVETLRGQPRLTQALAHLPLAEADLLATGRRSTSSGAGWPCRGSSARRRRVLGAVWPTTTGLVRSPRRC